MDYKKQNPSFFNIFCLVWKLKTELDEYPQCWSLALKRFYVSRHQTTVNSQQNLRWFIKHSIESLHAIRRIHKQNYIDEKIK